MPSDRPSSFHRVLVIGGGNGGLSVAGRLRRQGVTDIVVVEPRTEHFYKPLFSYIAGGTARAAEVVRDQGAVTPKGVSWIRDAVTGIDPEASSVTLASGATVRYEHLIVCPGIQQDWDAVPGLAEAVSTPEVASNYTLDLAVKTSRLLQGVTRGTVVFAQPPGPASCAGAIQKPMYQACAYWRARGVLDDIRVVLVVPDATVYGVPEVDRELERKIAEYGIELSTASTVAEVDGAARTVLIARSDGRRARRLEYDALVIEPPQSAPDWLAATTLADPGDERRFVEVDPRTLRHRRYPNVWALGDAAATTNSKSGGALRKQTMVLAKNLTAVLRGRRPSAQYDGYGVCPFTVSRSTVVFAEFDDELRLQPSVPFWRGLVRERRLTWFLDRHVLPWVYWNLILQGRA
ncbi:Sulfide dehydrogenase [flavocytochrome c] flavoprotein chain [Microbacterium lemovicicum]|uniref:Sulfide dehydrogenase [flavocytochrome c] flavoprotein chain n=1 Tax=Microbacterium lemovicicum TaxID=1072463 RepID=A0A3Q9IYN2_9MICO|nr:FAD/NAD(P)-binding oxidoreductase [Microbacterium lemovicicum]AZS37274.1 Sulfide dehydrogenase [flavocytochrome c] flavoprotein chain [Microbacterium lemovicicum]